MTDLAHGARVLLERRDYDPAGATYDLTVTTPERTHRALVSLDVSNKRPSVQSWTEGGVPEEWLTEFIDNLLATVVKNHGPDGDWPRRLHRWRDKRA